jgi:hypothetical protein
MMTVVHDDAPGWLCAACVFIESNAADHVSVVEVASAVGVDPDLLLRDFAAVSDLLRPICSRTYAPPGQHRLGADVRVSPLGQEHR